MPLQVTHDEPGAAVFALHTYDEAVDAAYDAVGRGQKVLVCTNRIKSAEELFHTILATGVAAFTTCPHTYAGRILASPAAARSAMLHDQACVVVLPDQVRIEEIAPASTLLIHAELPAYRYRHKFEAVMRAREARVARCLG